MRKICNYIILLAALLVPHLGLAQTAPFPPDQFLVARITAIEPGKTEHILNTDIPYLKTTLVITKGAEAGKVISTEEENRFTSDEAQAPKVGDLVTVRATYDNDGAVSYSIDDRYRLNALLWIAITFFALVIFFGRLRGAGAILGLGASIGILYWFIVPQLVGGSNPMLITFVGAVAIAITTMLLAHGFKKRTIVALASTLLALCISTLIASLFTHMTLLLGLGSESAFFLAGNVGSEFNFQGLLLGGIIIAMLGILDDVTTAQTATVDELHRANPALSVRELYTRGISVGREHIASLVNTLVLAYAGLSLPLFLLFTLNVNQPLWTVINSEPIAEEIVRTLAGSVALILAVPIATGLAAYAFGKKRKIS